MYVPGLRDRQNGIKNYATITCLFSYNQTCHWDCGASQCDILLACVLQTNCVAPGEAEAPEGGLDKKNKNETFGWEPKRRIFQPIMHLEKGIAHIRIVA